MKQRRRFEVDVHTYEKIPTRSADEVPPLGTARFRCAEDVAEWARIDHLLGLATWPEVWHLDSDGRPTCYYRASSMCSLQGWAEDPYPLLRSRQEGLLEGDCGSDWLIVDSRPRGIPTRAAVPDDVDAHAFLGIEKVLADVGVRLVDAVVFDDACHWWSLRELTKGTTKW